MNESKYHLGSNYVAKKRVLKSINMLLNTNNDAYEMFKLNNRILKTYYFPTRNLFLRAAIL